MLKAMVTVTVIFLIFKDFYGNNSIAISWVVLSKCSLSKRQYYVGVKLIFTNLVNLWHCSEYIFDSCKLVTWSVEQLATLIIDADICINGVSFPICSYWLANTSLILGECVFPVSFLLNLRSWFSACFYFTVTKQLWLGGTI